MSTEGKIRWSVTPAKAAKDTNISDTAFRTLAIIGMYTDENGLCYPSMNTIAKTRGVSRQAIQQHVSVLISAGYLTKKERFSKGSQQSNLLQVKFDFAIPPASPELAPPATSEVAPPASPELAQNDNNLTTPINDNMARPKKPRSDAQKENDIIHDAITEVTKCPSGSFNGKVTAQLKAELPDKAPEYIAAEVRRRFGHGGLWYKNDYRGRKGTPPQVQQIYPEWNRVLGNLPVQIERPRMDPKEAAEFRAEHKRLVELSKNQ
jgi:hypothetical protein